MLELGWHDGRREIDRDTEIAIDIFCEHLGDGLESAREPAGAAGAPLSDRASSLIGPDAAA